MDSIKELYMYLFQEESKEFVTSENLDEKIHEALDHEMELNFALMQTGERLGWSVKRKPKPENQESPGEFAWRFRLSKHIDHYSSFLAVYSNISAHSSP